jgi:excisionase family DNA binding protein
VSTRELSYVRTEPDHRGWITRQGERTIDRLLTASEVAEILGVHVNYVWAEAKAGRIPSITIGRNRRFIAAEIDEWLQRQRVAV